MSTLTPLTTRHSPLAARRGFTLVELLVVVVVIGILAGMVLGALQMARETARVAKTRATISKLHNILMGMYESYRTRRVPINTTGLAPSVAAQARLYALRDLMRMEMPDQWGDVTNGPQQLPLGAWQAKIPAPALWVYYNTRCTSQAPNVPSAPGIDFEPAKCLYMIVTYACHARNQFNENEIKVDPADNYPMFVDGWGNPIYFIRQAPGFIYSDIQKVVATQQGSSYGINSTLAQQATQTDHDPFDPMQVDTTNGASNGPSGWRLVPVIFSFGSSGLKFTDSNGNPPGKIGWAATTGYSADPTKIFVNARGAPVADKNGQFHASDIISNHWIQGGGK
jgi:prepilin-type N-terminal cleavage/methylation domain-containing protein